MANIFREALRLSEKNGARTEEEEKLLATASIPLDILPGFSDMTTKEGLEELAKRVEGKEANDNR